MQQQVGEIQMSPARLLAGGTLRPTLGNLVRETKLCVKVDCDMNFMSYLRLLAFLNNHAASYVPQFKTVQHFQTRD